MFGRKAQRKAIEALRLGALRAIYAMEHPDGPRDDVNPHSQHPQLTPYALASALTVASLSHIAHMIYAGQPQRVQPRRDWAVWELEHAGFAHLARELAEEIDSQRARFPE